MNVFVISTVIGLLDTLRRFYFSCYLEVINIASGENISHTRVLIIQQSELRCCDYNMFVVSIYGSECPWGIAQGGGQIRGRKYPFPTVPLLDLTAFFRKLSHEPFDWFQPRSWQCFFSRFFLFSLFVFWFFF